MFIKKTSKYWTLFSWSMRWASQWSMWASGRGRRWSSRCSGGKRVLSRRHFPLPPGLLRIVDSCHSWNSQAVHAGLLANRTLTAGPGLLELLAKHFYRKDAFPYIYWFHIPAAISPVLTMTTALSLYCNFWCVRLGGRRQERNGDTVTSSGGVYSCLSVDQEVLGGFLELSLWMKFRESVVGHTLASGVDGTEIGDNGDRLFYVIHGRWRYMRYDMFRTKTHACHIKYVIKHTRNFWVNENKYHFETFDVTLFLRWQPVGLTARTLKSWSRGMVTLRDDKRDIFLSSSGVSTGPGL